MYYPNRTKRAVNYLRKQLYVAMVGAIDIVTQERAKNPGSGREVINFEPGKIDGFRRIDGYERTDGRAAPSDATWYVVELSDASDRAIGETLTGNGGASGEIILIDGNYAVVTDFNGTDFIVSETTNGSGTVSAVQLQQAGLPNFIDNFVELSAQNYYRDLIQIVPGGGNILGVWRHSAEVYAFRNNVGGTAAILHRQTASGWDSIPFYHTYYFVTGTTDYNYGDAITSAGGGIGVVKKSILLGGSWTDNDATGYLVIEVTSGSFATSEICAGAGIITGAANAVAISFAPNGRFEFISTNFYASIDTYAVYGCDGVNPAFEIDANNVLTPIYTGSVPEAPQYLVAHKFHLMLAINSSILQSVVGLPYNFSGVLGAGEHAVGSLITGMKEQPGDVLTVATTRQTWGLYGTTINDFELKLVSKDTGARDYTFQSLGDPMGLDDRGVTSQQRVTAYGNFEAGTISSLIQPIIDKKKILAISSSVLRKRNQLRLYFSDKTAIVIAMSKGAKGGTIARSTTLELDHTIQCICNTEDENGSERVYFGSTDGYVYEMEKGFSFDGQVIEEFIRTNYYSPLNNDRQEFKLFGVTFNIKSEGNFTMSVTHDLSFSSIDIAPSSSKDVAVEGGGGFLDTDSWDEFYYDIGVKVHTAIGLDGKGTNVSFALYNVSNITKSYEIEGYTLDFSPRGIKRAY
jgi:hypothetical protein